MKKILRDIIIIILGLFIASHAMDLNKFTLFNVSFIFLIIGGVMLLFDSYKYLIKNYNH